MLARLTRPFAILFACLLVATSVWCLTTQPPPIRVAKKGGYTDVHLYHDIAAELVKGRPYHEAAADMHRLHHYPLKPFVTMRLPTLAEMGAHLGWKGVQRLAYALAFVAIFLWIIALEGRIHWVEQVLIGAAAGTGAAMVTNEGLMAMHEYWGGLFIAIALAVRMRWPRQWWWQVAAIALGLSIRELVLPYALLAAAFALGQRRWREGAAWVLVLAGFGAFLAWHAAQVQALVRPGDITSAGWHAAQGFSAFLKAVVYTSSLGPLPRPLALLLAMLPMAGWLALSGRSGLFCQVLIAGYVVMISAFSRADTFYWGGIMLPWYCIGWALLPRAFWQLWWSVRQPEGRFAGASGAIS